MGRSITYISVILIVAMSCEDIYHPDLKDVSDLPVIEARITNDPAFNYIRLNRTTGFADNIIAEVIPDAKIELFEEGGLMYSANHTVDGIYNFKESLKPGKQYRLRVVIDDETYESVWETLPPLPQIQEFYAETYTREEYILNLYGDPVKQFIPGFQISVDVPVTDELKNYIFRWHSILQYIIPRASARVKDTLAWKSFLQIGCENLAKPSLYSNTTLISKHKLMFNSKNYMGYIDTTIYNGARKHAYGAGWIFEIDQFGLSNSAFNFYQKVSELLNADGQLFDPVYSQLPGNMHCTSNPGKLLLGIFELSSVTRHQYFVTNVEYQTIYHHKIEPNLNIPYEGVSPGIRPFFWQTPRQ